MERAIGWFFCCYVTLAGASPSFPNKQNPPHVGSFLLLWPSAHRGPQLFHILVHPQWILCLNPLFEPLPLSPSSLSHSLSLFLLNEIIRPTALSDQLQLIILEHHSINQCTLHYITWCQIIEVTRCSCGTEGADMWVGPPLGSGVFVIVPLWAVYIYIITLIYSL